MIIQPIFLPWMRENANSYASYPIHSYFILAHVQSLNSLTEFNA